MRFLSLASKLSQTTSDGIDMRPIRTVVIGPQTAMLRDILKSVLAAELPISIVGQCESHAQAEALSREAMPDFVLVCEDRPLASGQFEKLCKIVSPAQLVVVSDGGRRVGSFFNDPGLKAVIGIIRAGCADRLGHSAGDEAHG